MERHTRLSRAAVVLVTIALIASIAAAVWFASPDAPYVPSEDSGAALGTAAPAEDGTVAGGYQPSSTSTGISDISTARNNPSGNYHLTQDITITSLHSDDKWDQAFSGTLDGAGHTITINAETKNTGCTDAGGLFIGVKAGATIKNMTIVVNSFHYGTSASGTANGGIIGGYASGDNITVDNVKVILNQDSSTMHHGTSTYNGVDTYMYSTTGDHNSIAFNLGGLFGKVEGGTTTIKNTTVYNSAGGKYGFSAWTWVSTPWIGNGESWINIGGFVGSVQTSGDKDGNLTLQNVKYDADDDAKISALAESGTDRNNYARLSPFLGVLNAGKFTVDNLIFNAGGTFTQMLYRDDTTTNEHNEGMYNGRGILIGYDVNKWLQTTDGVSSRKEVYLRNAITGDSGTGLGNGDDHTSLLAGNNSWLDGFMSYPSEIEDASFTDDGKIAFALPNRSGDIAKAVRQINQNGNVTTVSDAQIAEQVTEGGGLTWIEAPVVAHGDDTSVSASLNKVSTGTYNVQNYDAVSLADDSAYRGSKVYDGTTVKTPTLDVGGTTVNAWTADNTTADAGTKNFAYNEGALSGYAAATYNGGTYLVKGGTIYSPGKITVNGATPTFALGKDFVYEITKAPVTVTPSAPTDLYAGNPMPELTATAVDSGGSPVEGSIEWDDPDATLISGKHNYAWTWTPRSSNYQTVKGQMELEAFDRQIESLTIKGDFKKEYTAYEPFNSTGVEVYANYSDGTQAKLDDNKYEFTVVNGDINKLIVANNTVTVSLKAGATVSTTISIIVSKLVVDVPTENQGLVYTGGEQTGVAASADNYYSLLGNTGTNAAAYTATATLPDPDNTRWNTADADDTTPKEIAWSIAKKDVDITVGHTSKTYDGQEVDPTTLFTAQGVNNEELALTVAVDGGKTILNADTYSVTASLAESETNYTADPVTITYKVDKKLVSGEIVADNLVYDGTEKGATFNGQLIGEDKVEIKYAGDRINVTEAGFTATADLPSDNYAWADDTAPSETFMISPKEITVTATSGSREFNWNSCSEEELRALFTLSEAVDYKLFVNDAEAEIADGQVSAIYDIEEYKIAITSANANYKLVGTTSTTFTITVKKVEKPIISDVREFIYNGGEQGFEIAENQAYEVVGDTKATDAYDGYIFTIRLVSPGNVAWIDDTIGDITVEWKIVNATFTSVTIEFADGALDNLFTSSAMPTPTTITANPTPLPEGVDGKFEWVESSLSEGTNTYHWTYTVPNYNVFEGTKKLTARAAVLESITLSGEYKTEYTAYDFFDVENLVVTAHFSHGENQPGEDATLALGEYTLTTASAQYDENGVPQLFVADGYVTVTYQDKSVQIDIKVAPKQIAAPTAATGFVYDGTEKVGVTGGDGYTLSGDTTATDANDYFATAVLTDKDNTTWDDGTTDDKTIEWSIAKMVVSGEIVAPESLVYDGSQKAVSFNGQLAGNDEFGIAYDGDRQNVTADGFTVTVSLPNDNNYEWADGVVTTAAYKIEPKRVYLGHGDYTWGMSYNGVGVAVADLGGNTGDGNADLVFAYEDETLETKLDIVFDYVAREANDLTQLVNAGEYTIEFNLADAVVNYVADAYTTTLEITPMRVEATLTAPNEVYTGNEKNAILTVKTQLVGEDKVTVEYNDVDRIIYTGEEIVATAQLPNDNYEWADGNAPTASFTIQKAKITSVTVTVSDTPDGGWTTAMMPEFTSVSVEPYVEGEVVWDNGSLIAGENAKQPWTFVPATNNYEPYHGFVTLTVAQATLTGVSVDVVATKEYVAFDAFDRSSIVVKALYGEDRKQVTNYTLTFSDGSTEGRLFAGTGITVTVTYTDGDVTQYTEFTIDVAKRTVAKPVVDTTVFDATGETITLPIAESEYYTVEDNTAIEPGRYVATVTLKDPVNTMWEDGSTDDVSISWTITEPVTSDEVIADILAMEKVTWQNAEEFLDLEKRYGVLDESEQTAEATAKIAVLRAQYDALRNAAFDDIEAAHEVTAKSLGKALAAAAAGLSAAAIALAIAKRRSI